MTNTQNNQTRKNAMTVWKYLRAGLIAGAAAGVLNSLIYLIMVSSSNNTWDSLVAVSIIAASLMPNLLAALLYFVLTRLTSKPRPILTAAVIVFVLVSVLPHLGIGPAPSPALAALPEGFDLVTVPLHLVFGLTAITLLPWLVDKKGVQKV